jgi:hypothetical protein
VSQVKAFLDLLRPDQVRAALTATDANGNTALVLACAAGKLEVARLLLARGATVPVSADADGNNILHKARVPAACTPACAPRRAAWSPLRTPCTLSAGRSIGYIFGARCLCCGASWVYCMQAVSTQKQPVVSLVLTGDPSPALSGAPALVSQENHAGACALVSVLACMCVCVCVRTCAYAWVGAFQLVLFVGATVGSRWFRAALSCGCRIA